MLFAQNEEEAKPIKWVPPEELREGLKITKTFSIPDICKHKHPRTGRTNTFLTPRVSGNHLYAIDNNNQSMLKFSLDGTFEKVTAEFKDKAKGSRLQFLNDDMVVLATDTSKEIYNFDGKLIEKFDINVMNRFVDFDGSSALIYDFNLIRTMKGILRSKFSGDDTSTIWPYPEKMAAKDRQWNIWQQYTTKDYVFLCDSYFPGFLLADKSIQEATVVELDSQSLSEAMNDPDNSMMNRDNYRSKLTLRSICAHKDNVFLRVQHSGLCRIIHSKIDGTIEKVYEFPDEKLSIVHFDIIVEGNKPKIFAFGRKSDPETFSSTAQLVILEPGGELVSEKEVDEYVKRTDAAYEKARERHLAQSGNKQSIALGKRVHEAKTLDERLSLYKEMLTKYPEDRATSDLLSSLYRRQKPESDEQKKQLADIYFLLKPCKFT